MNIFLNAEPVDVPEPATVATAIDHLDLPPRGVAVAMDREVVPRSAWETTALSEGARLEVVRAVQGG